MCLGVKISRIVFGAYDTKSGACGSFTNLANTSFFNLKILTEDGILGEQCENYLKIFLKCGEKK